MSERANPVFCRECTWIGFQGELFGRGDRLYCPACQRANYPDPQGVIDLTPVEIAEPAAGPPPPPSEFLDRVAWDLQHAIGAPTATTPAEYLTWAATVANLHTARYLRELVDLLRSHFTGDGRTSAALRRYVDAELHGRGELVPPCTCGRLIVSARLCSGCHRAPIACTCARIEEHADNDPAKPEYWQARPHVFQGSQDRPCLWCEQPDREPVHVTTEEATARNMPITQNVHAQRPRT